VYSNRVNFTDVAERILHRAYDHVSGGGELPVAKRQLYYASRERFKGFKGDELLYNYFANTVLVQYMNRNPVETATWKITADPRGTLTLPNADHEVRIPCGTLPIEEHLEFTSAPLEPIESELHIPSEYPSLKHGERYQAVLYIEKEGFEPLLEQAQIAERYDLAILSCKGQSVVAGRHFVDQVCSVDGGVPLLVVHDFDKSGFEISQRLTRLSDRAEATDRVTYRFENTINVTDLGLRLEDVEKYKLPSEPVEFKGHFAYDTICTEEERGFLRSGKRVELNAFTSPQFLEWLEAKLKEQGLGKRLVPNDDVLEEAYRRAIAVAHVNKIIEETIAYAKQLAGDVEIPKTLRRQVQNAMKRQPEAWDKVVYHLVKAELDKGKLR